MALTLIYRIFTTLLGWTALCARSDTTKEIEILVLRQTRVSLSSPPRASSAPPVSRAKPQAA